MTTNRRRESRYVVEGLNLEVDGIVCHILDVSATHVRVLEPHPRLDQGAAVRLRFFSEPGLPAVDFDVTGAVFRIEQCQTVFVYASPLRKWPMLLASFDSFKTCRLSELEV